MKNITINNEFYYEVWFEIFITKENGTTQTISSVNNYNEIHEEMNRLYQINPDNRGKLNWDVWGSLDKEGWNTIQIENYPFKKFN
jgi:hypothetical protein